MTHALQTRLLPLIVGRAYTDARIYVITLEFSLDSVEAYDRYLDPYTIVADELRPYGFEQILNGTYYCLVGEGYAVSNLLAMQSLTDDLLCKMVLKYSWFLPNLRRASARPIDEAYDILDDLNARVGSWATAT